jgi:hypothetical protein
MRATGRNPVPKATLPERCEQWSQLDLLDYLISATSTLVSINALTQSDTEGPSASLSCGIVFQLRIDPVIEEIGRALTDCVTRVKNCEFITGFSVVLPLSCV